MSDKQGQAKLVDVWAVAVEESNNTAEAIKRIAGHRQMLGLKDLLKAFQRDLGVEVMLVPVPDFFSDDRFQPNFCIGFEELGAEFPVRIEYSSVSMVDPNGELDMFKADLSNPESVGRLAWLESCYYGALSRSVERPLQYEDIDLVKVLRGNPDAERVSSKLWLPDNLQESVLSFARIVQQIRGFSGVDDIGPDPASINVHDVSGDGVPRVGCPMYMKYKGDEIFLGDFLVHENSVVAWEAPDGAFDFDMKNMFQVEDFFMALVKEIRPQMDRATAQVRLNSIMEEGPIQP